METFQSESHRGSNSAVASTMISFRGTVWWVPEADWRYARPHFLLACRWSAEPMTLENYDPFKMSSDSRQPLGHDQAAARGLRSLLRFTILACQKRPKKEFKRYPIVNRNSNTFVGSTGPGRPARLDKIHPRILCKGFLKLSRVLPTVVTGRSGNQ